MGWKTEFAETWEEMKEWWDREIVWKPLPPITSATFEMDEETTNNMIAAAMPGVGLGVIAIKGAPALVTPIVTSVLKNATWAKTVHVLGEKVMPNSRAGRWFIDIVMDSQEFVVKLIKNGSKTSVHIATKTGIPGANPNVSKLMHDIA
ncbi:MAG: hypothetical protein JRH20_24490, partial [Deltaproteobacteria bacterium]|nr:hypothetical protein [Deltaproteobacteria bacterium]